MVCSDRGQCRKGELPGATTVGSVLTNIFIPDQNFNIQNFLHGEKC